VPIIDYLVLLCCEVGLTLQYACHQKVKIMSRYFITVGIYMICLFCLAAYSLTHRSGSK